MNIGTEFYAANALRNYPLDDAASAVDDAGGRLPPSILVDCSLRFPADYGRTARVSAVTVRPGLVTILFEASQGLLRPSLLDTAAVPAEAFMPLGGVTLADPIPIGTQVRVEAMQPGVGGWVVLGGGAIGEPYAGRFSTKAQSALLYRCARPYTAFPVQAAGKRGTADVIDGVMTIQPGNDVELATLLDEPERPKVIFALGARPDISTSRLYIGACGARPESGTCDPAPIERINDVSPDAAGNIDIRFTGSGVTIYAMAAGGMVADVPITLGELCPPESGVAGDTGSPPDASDDACADNTYLAVATTDDYAVASGVFAHTDDGLKALAGDEMAIALFERDVPARQIRAVFDLTTPDTGVNTAGIVFDYRAASDATAEAFYALIFDGPAGKLALRHYVNRVAIDSIEADIRMVDGDPGRADEGVWGALTVAIMEPDEDGDYHVVGRLESAWGTGAVESDEPLLGAGTYGVIAINSYPTFRDIHAEDTVSAS
jgi:hypothetical protein